MKVLTICMLLYSIQSFAESPRSFINNDSLVKCPTIDLTTKSPLSERKSLSQGDSVWCCSYAFVDALSLKYGKNFSPVDIAITHAHAKKWPKGCLNLDEIPKAINESHGLCNEDRFGQKKNLADNFENLKAGADFSKLFKLIENESYSNELENLELLWKETQTDPEFTSRFCEDDRTRYSPIFNNIKNYRELGAVIKESAGKDYYDFLYKMAEKNCPQREKVQVEYESIGVGQESISELYRYLNSGTAPVITISSQRLFKAPGPEDSLKKKWLGLWKGDHAVNLVGVRPIEGKCFVKIRDSAYGGKACNNINKSGVVCSPTQKDDGTYEVEIETFLKAAKKGMVIK